MYLSADESDTRYSPDAWYQLFPGPKTALFLRDCICNWISGSWEMGRLLEVRRDLLLRQQGHLNLNFRPTNGQLILGNLEARWPLPILTPNEGDSPAPYTVRDNLVYPLTSEIRRAASAASASGKIMLGSPWVLR